ncbi:pyruvate dehydrogenase (acetyl-transferring), homodimeric type [Meiothermus granaticius]|uniref:Pyruvate dehydrogenase E1 component n=1 Tax=Meiothermus granaticius NBRC 107808 TaxID=1227551 RepID=A0A399F795_9DEIN|nr:pyruvate dehydrogenase (acetyl-transferring), homodimeric type [Meiothermus granaticius]RIH92557.1 Pyruvate dehydrogenase E1 component [Meiothermus granaticius NBRC 107808]GEM87045.1 pyruvate dehydrogenase E1 component [Meiothermus granaticius NBRC 107808]
MIKDLELIEARANLSAEEQVRLEDLENKEWLESLEYVLRSAGRDRVVALLESLERYAYQHGVQLPYKLHTPYINTIPADHQPEYPGDLELEQRIANILRWNTIAIVQQANKKVEGIGGHISTYASIAELMEMGFNHFFRGLGAGMDRDLVFYQGHMSPGVYARSFLEGRFSADDLAKFRRDLTPGPGRVVTSYPHPWLMPDYWEFPTVSMGLGPLQAIYQARFMRYLEDRGLKPKSSAKVWAFLGDGEQDEVETLGGLRVAATEELDNLVFVINANLQRLDGPVRGNSKVIQELERIYRGNGWNVIKVVWGSAWDELLAKDTEGVLIERFESLVDGESQRYAAYGAKELREHFFNTPALQKLIEGYSDEQLEILTLSRGGHDKQKVYAAYKMALEHRGSPTAIIARTVKGYGLGPTAQAKNVAHQVKKLNLEDLREARDFLGIPVSDEDLEKTPFYHPGPDSPEVKYMLERRQALGGLIPERKPQYPRLNTPDATFFEEFYAGSGEREISTTMAFVRMLTKLVRHPEVGQYIVPIVPDEARTFGMEGVISTVGIYSPKGQLYQPVDAGTVTVYRESRTGQLLQEGINEAGATASFIAAGTAYAHWGIPTIPFYIYYSMFGLQRVGDLIWAAGDQRTKGFLLGGTAGRTTLNGEGLQHEDGHSHVLALSVPNLRAYDPAFAYELAVILEDGMRRMYKEGEDVFYYLTLMNENYLQPAMPEPREQVREGILKGIYRFSRSGLKRPKARVQLLGSGTILNEVLEAAKLLETYGVAADVWSVTSYKSLYYDALETARWNRLHPTKPPKKPFIAQALEGVEGPIVAASDYMKALPDLLSGYLNQPIHTLGTDGFGRSDTRKALRDFFEVDRNFVTATALSALAQNGKIEPKAAAEALKKLGIDPEREPAHKR